MTYVLILAPAAANRWPAVIGGYRSEAEALRAGQLATMAPMTQQGFEDAGWGMNTARSPIELWLWMIWRDRPWIAFTVIPGGVGHNAENTPGPWSGQAGAPPGTYVRVTREELDTVVRG